MSSWYPRIISATARRGTARIQRTVTGTGLSRLATPVVLPATLRRSPGRSWRGLAPPDPRQAAGPAPHAAKLPATCAAHDCGPLRMIGTGERSVPSAGGPYHSRPKSFRDAPSGGAYPARGTGGCQSSGRAVGLAPGALCPSGTSVLVRHGDGQPFPAFLAAARQHLAAPAGRHPGPKTMLVDSPPVPRPV